MKTGLKFNPGDVLLSHPASAGLTYDTGKIIITPKRVSDKTVDWVRKFEEALGGVRQAAKQTGISAKDIDEAVKTARQRSDR